MSTAEAPAKKRHFKIWLIVCVMLVIIIGGFLLFWEINHGNRQLIDVSNRFNRAIIALPNGGFVEGKVNSWTDYADSDVVQVTIDGTTYLTSYVNVVLIHE